MFSLMRRMLLNSLQLAIAQEGQTKGASAVCLASWQPWQWTVSLAERVYRAWAESDTLRERFQHS